MEEEYQKRILSNIILILVIVAAFFVIKPILMAIIFGLILAFIFSPVYNWFFKITKLKTLSALLLCFFLIILVAVPFWFLTPLFLEQGFEIYLASQKTDFVTPLQTIFSSLFPSEELSKEVGSIIYSFVTNTINSFLKYLSNILLNFPILCLQALVVFFTLFFVIRDKKEFIDYIKSLLPFSKDIEDKLFEYTRGITASVLYGQILVGILQGVIAGIGFFIFGVPNALFFTFLAILAGVFPILGPFIVWVPIFIYLLINNLTSPALGVFLFGMVSSTIDNFLRPLIISKKTGAHSSIVAIGMIGGVLVFGVLGVVLGPLILIYLLVLLELYRKKKPDFKV